MLCLSVCLTKSPPVQKQVKLLCGSPAAAPIERDHCKCRYIAVRATSRVTLKLIQVAAPTSPQMLDSHPGVGWKNPAYWISPTGARASFKFWFKWLVIVGAAQMSVTHEGRGGRLAPEAAGLGAGARWNVVDLPLLKGEIAAYYLT